MCGLLVVVPFAGLVPDNRAGFLARTREARASPETLPPGEGRRGARARLSVGAKGRGITRPARSAQRGGRPGKPLRPVKRTALRGGTGGSHERTRALRAWPHKGRGVRLDRIPLAPRSPRLARGSPHLLRPELSSLPPLSRRRALHGGELNAPDAERRKASRLVGRFGTIAPAYRVNE